MNEACLRPQRAQLLGLCWYSGILLALLLFGFAIPEAQSQGLTEEQGQAILEELRSIRRLFERSPNNAIAAQPIVRPPQAAVVVQSDRGHTIGRHDAPLTLVEFTDYECPYCRRFDQTTFPELKRRFIDTGHLRFISRDLPIESHSHAFQAAMAGRCADEQLKYWEYREAMFRDSNSLNPASFTRYADSIGLVAERFATCLENQSLANAVRADAKEAFLIGATGTPTFVLGRTPINGSLEGRLISGAQPLAVFEGMIHELLRETQ